MNEELLPFCECGECGLRVTKKGNRFIKGHNKGNLGKKHTPKACAAMSAATLGVPRPHISPAQIAADNAQRGKPHTSEAQISADDSQRGVPRTPEACAAISAGKLGVPNPRTSPAQLAAIDMQRGGDDLVEHHYIYDHSDFSKNTVGITRADHTSLHNLLRRLGYIIPHINESQKL